MAENTIDNLSIQVTASAERAVRTFDRLASSAGRLRGAASTAGSGMHDMASGARDAGEATAEAGTQAGNASRSIGRLWDSLRRVGSQIRGGFVRAVHGGISAIRTFTRSLARIAFNRAIRSIIKDIGQSFKDLYGYSRMFGTDFARSMDRITTASVYLRNSLAAMVAPLINMFAPAIDMIADKIVDILNFVNQLFASLNGQATYTVAKKVATTWESTFDSTANHAKKRIKEVRNTLLGFDEINRLNGATPSTSGSTGSSPYTPGYSTMFEEKPLEGFFKKLSDFTSGMPNWLKWLFGGATLVGGFLLIKKFIPWLLKKLGELFAIKIPDWIKWLFGPKGGGDNGLDIPTDIKIPDADLTVDLKRGNWNLLNELDDPITKVVMIDLQKGPWDNTAWLAAVMADIIITRTIKAVVQKGEWNDTAWLAATMAPYSITRTVTANVKQGEWNDTAWLASNMTPYVITRTVTAVVKAGEWNNTAWLAANMTNYAITRTVTAVVKAGEWSKTAWTAATMTAYAITRTVTAVVKQGEWNKTAWTAATMTAYAITRTVTAVVKQGAWDKTAWLAANMTNYAPTRTVTAVVKKGTWIDAAWEAANMVSQTIPITIEVGLKFKKYKSVSEFIDDNFGGATGGGGKTPGSGAGRDKHVDVEVGLQKDWLGTPISELNLDDLTTSVVAGLYKESKWRNNNDGTLGYLGVKGLKTSITSYLIKTDKWKDNGWQKYLGLNDLVITIKTKLQKQANNKVTYSFKGGGTGKGVVVGEIMKRGGAYFNGAWHGIPQYANGTLNAGTIFAASRAPAPSCPPKYRRCFAVCSRRSVFPM